MDASLKRPLGLAPAVVCLLTVLAFDTANADVTLRERVAQLGEGPGRTLLGGAPLASNRLLQDFYRRRDYRYAWRTDGQVQDLLRLVEASVDEGLRPSDFHAQQLSDLLAAQALADLPLSQRSELDILLSDSLLRLIHHYRYGKVDPERLGRKWHQVEGPFADELAEDLERVLAAHDLQVEVEGLTSKPPFYLRLKQGLARYRGILAAGGWPTVPVGKLIKPGVSDSRVALVRERLRTTGDFIGADSESPQYDRALQDAVRSFQARHQLAVDGVLGPATIAAMNVPVEERIAQIRANLERMRWLYNALPDDLLLVDIAKQEVQLIQAQQVMWKSRIIVGRPDRPTPVFRDQIEYLEINPLWTVPPTILRKDVLPAMRKNPSYLKKKGLQVVTRSGDPVSPESVNWHTSAASFPYKIRQPPGQRNALGRIKFMFPNRFSVYLHDTPDRGLFSKPKRFFSSGCVRVEHPWKLAELLLQNPERWNESALEEAAVSERTHRLNLKEPLAVVLTYWTAEGGTEGEVRFREDVYGRDSELIAALGAPAPGPIRLLSRKPQAPDSPQRTATQGRRQPAGPITAKQAPKGRGKAGIAASH